MMKSQQADKFVVGRITGYIAKTGEGIGVRVFDEHAHLESWNNNVGSITEAENFLKDRCVELAFDLRPGHWLIFVPGA